MCTMGIFSESPKSFKMDRKSPLASRLKSLVSKKLQQFLGNYTDDVLAEYIVVLVCNGKHQIQARDDLEAFLGERSGEFVSWLWDHLLKYTHQSNAAASLLDPKDVTVTSPINGGADSDLRSERLEDVQKFVNADNPLATNGKYCHPFAHTTSPVSSNNLELSEGIQYCKGSVVPLDAVVTNKVQSQIQGSTIPREIGATETFHDDSLIQKPSKIGGYSLIPTRRDQSLQCMDKSKKIVGHKGSPSRAVGERSCQSKMSRGSVWDRLGKPCKEKCFINDETVDAHAIDVVEKDQEIYDNRTLSVAVHNEEHCGSMKNEVQELDKSNRKLDQGVSAACKLHAANNIRRKRHFGEISSSPDSCSLSLLGRSNMDRQHKESSRDIERSNSTSEAAAPALTSQVQDVKQRLRQIEMEISKLQTKQLEIKRDGKPPVLLNFGFVKQSREDEESRTVFVTNVHFAATEEALSLHFAKCGLVLNVVMLIDKLNAQSKGSAYITFSHKESVDKAVALSGTSFFSRTLKVVRKTEEATVAASTPPLQTGKPSQAQFSQIKWETVFERPFHPGSHLQWRREPVSAPSEPSASITKEKGVSSAASSQQQLSSSHASLKIKRAVTSSTETPAGANLSRNSGCC